LRVLLTRPEPDAARSAAALRARGHEVVLAPLLLIQPVAFTLPQRAWAGVVLTSANAARVLAGRPDLAILARLPVFAVGRRTAEAARAAGFHEVHSADGDKDDLARLIAARRGAGGAPLLHLAGVDRAGELVDCGAAVETVVVYRAVKAERFPPAAERALAAGAIDGVLHYSRRTAEAFLVCAAQAGLRERALAVRQFCLSQQVAAPLLAAGAADVVVASHPDEPALMELIGSPS
jgi:uroporphyrinogen-III synthase